MTRDVVDIGRLIDAARRHWRGVAAGAAIGTLIALAYARTVTPRYEATSTVRIDVRPSTLPTIYADQAARDEIFTEIEVLRSRTIAADVVDSLALAVEMEQPRRMRRSDVFTSVRQIASPDVEEVRLVRGKDGNYRIDGTEEQVTPGVPFTTHGVRLVLAANEEKPGAITLRLQSARGDDRAAAQGRGHRARGAAGQHHRAPLRESGCRALARCAERLDLVLHPSPAVHPAHRGDEHRRLHSGAARHAHPAAGEGRRPAPRLPQRQQDRRPRRGSDDPGEPARRTPRRRATSWSRSGARWRRRCRACACRPPARRPAIRRRIANSSAFPPSCATRRRRSCFARSPRSMTSARRSSCDAPPRIRTWSRSPSGSRWWRASCKR